MRFCGLYGLTSVRFRTLNAFCIFLRHLDPKLITNIFIKSFTFTRVVWEAEINYAQRPYVNMEQIQGNLWEGLEHFLTIAFFQRRQKFQRCVLWILWDLFIFKGGRSSIGIYSELCGTFSFTKEDAKFQSFPIPYVLRMLGLEDILLGPFSLAWILLLPKPALQMLQSILTKCNPRGS